MNGYLTPSTKIYVESCSTPEWVCIAALSAEFAPIPEAAPEWCHSLTVYAASAALALYDL